MKNLSENRAPRFPLLRAVLLWAGVDLGAFVLKGGIYRSEKELATEKEKFKLGIPIKAALNMIYQSMAEGA